MGSAGPGVEPSHSLFNHSPCNELSNASVIQGQIRGKVGRETGSDRQTERESETETEGDEGKDQNDTPTVHQRRKTHPLSSRIQIGTEGLCGSYEGGHGCAPDCLNNSVC